jgi:hypothetical protein
MINNVILITIGTVMTIGVAISPVVKPLVSFHYDPNKDPDLMRECHYYADHNPQGSIPKARQEFLTDHGVDWEKYDYYQMCIDQKRTN